MVAVLVGLVAAYSALVRFQVRTRGRSSLPAPFSRRGHMRLGSAFALMLAVGYGLGVWSVHRAGRDVLTTPHALVGTVLVLFMGILTFLGTALASREEDRLTRLHRTFDFAAYAFVLIQVVLGVGMLTH